MYLADPDLRTRRAERQGFFKTVTEQYGFDYATAKILWAVWLATKALCRIEEQSWRFARALSALQYDGFLFAGAAGTAYDDGTGNTLVPNQKTWNFDVVMAKHYFVNVLGLSLDEFRKLEYNVQLQHRVCNPDDAYALDVQGKNMDLKRQQEEFEKMKAIYGFEWDWENEADQAAFKIEWNKRYDNMINRPDFAHLQYALAATLATELGHDSWVADLVAGGDEKREAKAGWLGDATIMEPRLSFSGDDYQADLDAENILKFMNSPPKRSIIEATQLYYNYIDDPTNHASRATVFVSDASPADSTVTWSGGNTNVANVKREILDELVGLIATDVQSQTVVPVEQLTDEQVAVYYDEYITQERYPTAHAFVAALEAGAAAI